MSDKISIRPIPVDRVMDIIDVWEKTGLPYRPMGRDRPENLRVEIERDPEFVVGAWDGDRLVGVLIVTDDGRKGWLNRLAVLPEYRGRGIASKMVKYGEDVLRKRGREVIAVLIEDDNPLSMEIFKHLGYVKEEHIFYFTKRYRLEA